MDRDYIKKYLKDYLDVINTNVMTEWLIKAQVYISATDMKCFAVKDYGFVYNDFYKLKLESKLRLENYMYFITCGSYNVVFSLKNEKIAKFYFGKNCGTGYDNEVYVTKELVRRIEHYTNFPELARMVNAPIAYDLFFDAEFLYKYSILHIIVLIRLFYFRAGVRRYPVSRKDIRELIRRLNRVSPRNTDTTRNNLYNMYDQLFPDTDSSKSALNRKMFTNILESVYEKLEGMPRVYMFSDFKKLLWFFTRKHEFFISTSKVSARTSHVLFYEEGISAVRDNFICTKYSFKPERYFRLLFLNTCMWILTLATQDVHFRHNDLKPDNILVFPNPKRWRFRFRHRDLNFSVRERIIFKISDFGLSSFAQDPESMQNKDRSSYSNMEKYTWRDDIAKFMEMFGSYFEQRVVHMGKFYILIVEYNKLTDPVDQIDFLIDMLRDSYFDEWRKNSSMS